VKAKFFFGWNSLVELIPRTVVGVEEIGSSNRTISSIPIYKTLRDKSGEKRRSKETENEKKCYDDSCVTLFECKERCIIRRKERKLWEERRGKQEKTNDYPLLPSYPSYSSYSSWISRRKGPEQPSPQDYQRHPSKPRQQELQQLPLSSSNIHPDSMRQS